MKSCVKLNIVYAIFYDICQVWKIMNCNKKVLLQRIGETRKNHSLYHYD